MRVLRRYREEQERWYRAHGRIASGYVFTALDGGPLSPDYLTQTFTQLVKASGLPPVRLHDPRRGAASLALAAGVDLKVVADQRGLGCDPRPHPGHGAEVATPMTARHPLRRGPLARASFFLLSQPCSREEGRSPDPGSRGQGRPSAGPVRRRQVMASVDGVDVPLGGV